MAEQEGQQSESCMSENNEEKSPKSESEHVDVRIIVEGASDVEALSRAVQKLSLGSKYNITVSSIIPTTSIELALKVVEGADIALIATDADRPGRQLADMLSQKIKNKVGHIERMKFPLGHDLEHINIDRISEELQNAIIRSGLSSLKNIKEYRSMVTHMKDLERATIENKETIEKLEKEKENLADQIRESASLQVFKTDELIQEVFGAENGPTVSQIEEVIGYLGVQPNLIAGQGFIVSINKEGAIKAIKMANAVLNIAKRMIKDEREE